MSCSAGRPTFRLLDQRVGWCDVEYNAATQGWVDIGPAPVVDNLTGWADSDGIQLLLASGAPGEGVIAFGDLLASLPPRRLARGCGPGSWLLLTPGGMILRRDPCTGCWRPIWCAEHPPEGLEAARALASSTDRFAIVGATAVQVWTVAGETQVAEIAVKDAERVAFFPGGDLLVASSPPGGSILLQRFGPVGDPLERVALAANITGPVSRLAVDVNDQVWLATGADPSSRLLWSGPLGGQFVPAAAANLAAAFPPTGLIGSSSKGFCLQETGANGIAVTSCSSWDGCPIPVSCVPPPAPPQWQTSGSITSGWIDSGISRCRWHRVRVDADMPMGTGIEISVVTTDFDPSSPTFEKPSSSDWQQGPAGALDVLVQQPPGQFLQLSLVLTSDGTHTPVVRSVRIDFPRRTSLDWLPAVYRENVEAEDFTERFLANFDSSIDDVDAAIARFPALLETNNVPSQVLPWLGSFLDVVFDPTWPDTERRKILNTLPTLYAQRGTLAGLSAAILLIFGVNPAIRELATERSWGALADSSKAKADALVQPSAAVGSVRLFGKAKSRFRLGHSALGVAPIHAYGNPDLDPLNAEAYRFEIQIPSGTTGVDRNRLNDLIASQKPAHTTATVRFGGDGFVVGVWSAVGIDTAFMPLPAPTLGASGNVRLRRASLVAAGTPRGRLPLAIGVSSVVGVQTLLE